MIKNLVAARTGRHVLGTGKCLDVTSGGTAEGTRVQIWTCTGAGNQKWTAPDGGTPVPSPGAMAVAPYLHNGWGSPPNPTTVNRDRPCTGGGADTCSGVVQQPWEFTRVFAQYGG